MKKKKPHLQPVSVLQNLFCLLKKSKKKRIFTVSLNKILLSCKIAQLNNKLCVVPN